MLGETGGSFGCGADLTDVTQHGSQSNARIDGSRLELLGDLLGHKADVVENRGQQIVEIVRHPAGELTEAFEPVGLVQPRLEEIALVLNRRPVFFSLGFDTVAGIANRGRYERTLVRVDRRE